MPLLPILVVHSMTALPATRVDFVVGGNAAARAVQTQIHQPGPIHLLPPAQAEVDADAFVRDNTDNASTPFRKPLKSHFSVVSGYGKAIPLSFAARQIVPAGVAVAYGPGVATDDLVDWTGGRPWNQVLATTAAEHGYRVVTGHLSVKILTGS